MVRISRLRKEAARGEARLYATGIRPATDSGVCVHGASPKDVCRMEPIACRMIGPVSKARRGVPICSFTAAPSPKQNGMNKALLQGGMAHVAG